MIFLVVSTWVMMNLFALVITDYFENYSMKADNPLEVFTDNLEVRDYLYPKSYSGKPGSNLLHTRMGRSYTKDT